MKVYIDIQTDDEILVPHEWTSAIEAIAKLQAVIDHIRRAAAPTFDASWGEQPMPVLGPNAAELQALRP